MHYIGILLVLAAIGAAVWWLLTNREEPGSPRRDVPRGPDDDPDFLRDLDRKRRPR